MFLSWIDEICACQTKSTQNSSKDEIQDPVHLIRYHHPRVAFSASSIDGPLVSTLPFPYSLPLLNASEGVRCMHAHDVPNGRRGVRPVSSIESARDRDIPAIAFAGLESDKFRTYIGMGNAQLPLPLRLDFRLCQASGSFAAPAIGTGSS